MASSTDSPEIRDPRQPAQRALRGAVAAWVRTGRPGPLLRWVDRELDPTGQPIRLEVGAWWPVLALWAEARSQRPEGWPLRDHPAVAAFLGAAMVWRPALPHLGDAPPLWPGRPGGSRADRMAAWRAWELALGLTPRARAPFASVISPARPRAALIGGEPARPDGLFLDQTGTGPECRLVLIGNGKAWLGTTWGRDDDPTPARAPRVNVRSVRGPGGDLAEWRFATASGRVVRTALLLPGRQLALVAEEVEGVPETASMRVALPDGVEPVPIVGSSSLVLANRPGRSARVFPLGVPADGRPAGLGSLQGAGGALVLEQPTAGRRCWLPLLVSWNGRRDRAAVRWRRLTVSERSRVCPAHTAVAFRVAWGLNDQLVVYRSLARPARRAFLGHSTTARLLVGTFRRSGTIEPLLALED